MVTMHPLRERRCDQLLNDPLLATPPPTPPKPKPPRVRKPREFKLPPRFPLLPVEFYARWCTHRKELHLVKCQVNCKPPAMLPEVYLKPQCLDFFAQQFNKFMEENKNLIKRINLIQRNGGFVNCHLKQKPIIKNNKLLCKYRQRKMNSICKRNLYLYNKLMNAKPQQITAHELDELWKETKQKLILSSLLPFILFKTERIDRDIKDPALEKPLSVYRRRAYLDIRVGCGSKIGKVVVELFTDIVPKTCLLFLNLVRGDENGYSYGGTRIFRVVPGLYCRAGDVSKDNGYGCYIPPEIPNENLAITNEPMHPENFALKHTVPGVLSMAVTKDNEVCGQFNIIFKPLPQFDDKNVVFGRIISGPSLTLERISAQGLPLGSTGSADVYIHSCGWITRNGTYREGNQTTIKFPPRSRQKFI